VRLTPRGGADRVERVADGELRVRVAAPPVDGAANEALVRLLARELDLPRSAIRIASGALTRRKVMAVEASVERIAERWPGLRLGV
jgi:uncharacterized protein YggU (UPF0235/DUF167 family)